MSSLAQEESRSISENVTWGQRKRFADGKVRLPYKQFLGYRKGADGFPEIVPEEAETIRLIYRLFMQGKNTNFIAKTLTEQGIPTPSGRDVWKQKTIESILRNEKYKGSALLQKTFTVDFLEKRRRSTRVKYPNTMLSTAILQSSTPRKGRAFSVSWHAENPTAEEQTITVLFRAKSYAVIAVKYTVQRYGILPINIAVKFGNAMRNSITSTGAAHRIYMTKRLKNILSRH